MEKSPSNSPKGGGKKRGKTSHQKQNMADPMELMMESAKSFGHIATPLIVISSGEYIVYLMGTNHAIPQCQEDVATVIKAVQPQSVVLELCASRICGCPEHKRSIFQVRPEFSYEYLTKVVQQIGKVAGLIFYADVYKERQVADGRVYLDYGGEMVRAILEARMIKGCEILLGDRPIEVTLQRQASALSYWKRMQLIVQVSLAMRFQRWKDWLLLNASQLVFQDQKSLQVLVVERDIYLTLSIEAAAKRRYDEKPITSVVAVVGQGHLNGILSFWSKLSPKILPHLMDTNNV